MVNYDSLLFIMVLDDSGDYVHHIMKWIMRINAWVWIFEEMHEWLMHDIYDKFMMHCKLNRLTIVCCVLLPFVD